MFRLAKLVAYALFGYALYEFFRGLTGCQSQTSRQSFGQGRQRAWPRQDEVRPGDSGNAHAGNMHFSGPGEGQPEATADGTGNSTPHIVGRGVVRR